MNSTYIPTPIDSGLVMQAAVTKTSSFDTTGLDLGVGFAPGGVGEKMAAVVDVSAITTTGGETYSLKLQESDTLGSGYSDCGPALSITAVGVVSLAGIVSKRYVRIDGVLATGSPSITFSAYLAPNV